MKMRIKTKDIPKIKQGLLIKQSNFCALCKKRLTESKDACLDHCHRTGHLREVLCRNCNGIEGKIFNLANRAKRDATPEYWLRNLLNYWIKHQEDPTGVFHPSHKSDEEKREDRNRKARLRRAKTKAKKNVKGK